MDPDHELLRRFAEEASQEAFAELVRVKVNLVFAAALRQTGGDVHLAEDVTQAVFLALAQRAARLRHHAVLAGWLFTTTRHLAISAVRRQRRWQRREQEANDMTKLAREEGPAWEQMRPVIDEALHDLPEKDRDALVLRFFEGRSLAQVGTAIGLPENSARMRVERALEKLRVRLAARGIVSTVTALGTALASQPTVMAPASVVAAASAHAMAGAGTGWTIFTTMICTKTKVATLAAVLALGGGWYFTATNGIETGARAQESELDVEAKRLTAENRRLQDETRQRATELAAAAQQAAVRPSVDPQARLRELVAVLDSGLAGRLTWAILSVSQNLNAADLSEILSLTAAETAAVQRTVDQAKQEIATAALTRARTIRSGDQFIIELREFPEARESYERMQAGLRATLGDERYAAFEKLGCLAAMEGMLGHLGLATYTNVLTHPANPPRPNVTYLFERIKGVVEPIPPGGSFGSAVAGGDRSSLETNFGPLMALVPADF